MLDSLRSIAIAGIVLWLASPDIPWETAPGAAIQPPQTCAGSDCAALAIGDLHLQRITLSASDIELEFKRTDASIGHWQNIFPRNEQAPAVFRGLL